MSLRAPRATKVAAAPKAGSLASVDSLEGAFRRLLSHPPDQPLVHVDHSRRVEPAPRMHPPATPTDVFFKRHTFYTEMEEGKEQTKRVAEFYPGLPNEDSYDEEYSSQEEGAGKEEVRVPKFMVAQASENAFKFWGFADPDFPPHKPLEADALDDPDGELYKEFKVTKTVRKLVAAPNKAPFAFKHYRIDVNGMPKETTSEAKKYAYADLTFVLDAYNPELGEFDYVPFRPLHSQPPFCLYEINHEQLSKELLQDLLQKLEWQKKARKGIKQAKHNYLRFAAKRNAAKARIEQVLKDAMQKSELKEEDAAMEKSEPTETDAKHQAEMAKAKQDYLKVLEQLDAEETELELELKNAMRTSIFIPGWLEGEDAKVMYDKFCSAVLAPGDPGSAAALAKVELDHAEVWMQQIFGALELKKQAEEEERARKKKEVEEERARKKKQAEEERARKDAAKAEQRQKSQDEKARLAAEREEKKRQMAAERALEEQKRKDARDAKRRKMKAERDAKAEKEDAAAIARVLDKLINDVEKKVQQEEKATEMKNIQAEKAKTEAARAKNAAAKAARAEVRKEELAQKTALEQARSNLEQNNTVEAKELVKQAMEAHERAKDAKKRVYEETADLYPGRARKPHSLPSANLHDSEALLPDQEMASPTRS